MTHYFTPHPLPHAVQNTNDTPSIPRLLAALHGDIHWSTVQVRDCQLELAAGAGVFSKGGLDAGSRLLIETVTIEQNARICDLGCGWGPVGCFMASLYPHSQVWMCDINSRAVAFARLNIEHNQLPNATAWCGNGLDAAREQTFDVILSNPPVRAGNRVIEKLFNDAFRCLKDDGTLWVVLRTAQGAKSWQKRLATHYGNCDTVDMAHGYRILKSIKRA